MILTCFKVYDIRGQIGDELSDQITYRIVRALAQNHNAKKVVVGSDARATSEPLKPALAQGVMDAGCDVIDLSMTVTEEIYFAAFRLDVDGGIEVTPAIIPLILMARSWFNVVYSLLMVIRCCGIFKILPSAKLLNQALYKERKSNSAT